MLPAARGSSAISSLAGGNRGWCPSESPKAMVPMSPAATATSPRIEVLRQSRVPSVSDSEQGPRSSIGRTGTARSGQGFGRGRGGAQGEVAEGAEEREQRDDRELCHATRRTRERRDQRRAETRAETRGKWMHRPGPSLGTDTSCGSAAAHHERHDGRVGGARDDIGERTLDEVDVRDAHAHRREHDPEERQHGERTARRSRESRLQQLRVSETTAELARLGPLGGGEPRRGHRGQGAEREGEE
eukprot:3565097-Prymnesium_polylepis.2